MREKRHELKNSSFTQVPSIYEKHETLFSTAT